MKNRLVIYDNIASSGDCTGRLTVFFELISSPRVRWEFESLVQNACEPNSQRGILSDPFTSDGFLIPRPYITSRQWGSLGGPPRVFMAGVANEVVFGTPTRKAHTFNFLLPNAQFLHTNLTGQRFILKTVKVQGISPKRRSEEGTEGRFFQVVIDKNWRISLDTRETSLKWLDPNSQSSGTLLTTLGVLHSKKTHRPKKGGRKPPRQTIAIDTAIRKLSILSTPFAFANGGKTSPLYVSALVSAKSMPYSCKIIPFRTTPIELLGSTWLTIDSDLKDYFECISSVLQMEKVPHWQESLPLILEWYFQAIQPESAQVRGKPWPVVANALGAALERLSYSIVVIELNIRGLSNATDKIKELLIAAGLTKSRGYQDTDDVSAFVGLRNDATHPRPKSAISNSERNRLLAKATQWIEEILLWRLGYGGKYLDRSQRTATSIEPRYDLKSRCRNW